MHRWLGLAWIVCACSGPPDDGGVIDATPGADGSSVDSASPDAPRPDAPLVDAGPDAPPPPDAAWPDATPVDAGPPPDVDPLDPYDIQLTDVTFPAVGAYIPGGRDDGDLWGVGSGAAIADLDGDGDKDVFIARIDDDASPYPHGPSTILWNTGGVTFGGDLVVAALFEGRKCHGVAIGDVGRDGDLDVFVGCEGADALLENDGTGHFVDVAVMAGVAGPAVDVTMGAWFADVNKDGILDLYTDGHTAASPPFPAPEAANRLYLGLADGTFVDVSVASGTASQASTQASVAADLTMSGNLTIYNANDKFAVDGSSVFGDPALIPGDDWFDLVTIDGEGVPTYTQRNVAMGVVTERSSMGVAIADVDDDLTPDLYISDWGEKDLYLNPTPGSPVDHDLGYDVGLRHDFDGDVMVGWGVKFVDLDRDGLLELFIVNGSVGVPASCANFHQLDYLLRRVTPGAPFVDVTDRSGLPWPPLCFAADRPASGRGALFGDLDGDGDDDLIVTPYVEPYRFYRNDTPVANHWLRLRLVGTVSSPYPAGATLAVTTLAGVPTVRFVYAGGDTFSQSDAPIEVGLGADTGVASAEIAWPSGYTERLDAMTAFAIDTELTIVEPAWLTVEPRIVAAADPAPALVYTPMDDTGAPLGVAGAGRIVTATRSDGVAVTVTDMGDGTYTAPLPHPGLARRTVVTLTVDGVTQRPRPMIDYR